MHGTCIKKSRAVPLLPLSVFIVSSRVNLYGLIVRQARIRLESGAPTNPAKSNTVRNAILRQGVRFTCMVSRVVTLKLEVLSANLQCRHCPFCLPDFAVFIRCTELSTRPKTFGEHKHKLFQVITSVTFNLYVSFWADKPE